MKRMRKVMALFVVVAMLFNLCPLSATADVRRNNMPASLGNADIQPSNDDKGDKSAINQDASDAQVKNENKAASDAQAKNENKDTTDTKTKIDKEEDTSDSTQIQADTSASEKTEETTATEKAADNKEASTEAVTDSTEASSTEVINDSEASTTETAVANDEGKAQSEKDDDKAETKDEKSDKKDDEDKDEKMPAFSETKSIDGVKITVSADKDVFPEGVTLSIRKVSKADGRNVDKAIDKIREAGVNVAAAYTFDIKIVDKDGNEIQPADDKKVRVSFEAEEVGNDNLAADIYHITGKGKKLSAEMLDSAEHDDKVTASTGGFSLYTVEFTYDEIQYVMEGDTSVALSDILDEVGLIGKVTEVEVSDESLFSAKKKDGEWMVTANKAFSSTEWMKVTIDGVVYEIVVTDDYNNWIGDFSKMVTFAGERDWYLISCDDTTATLWYYGTKDYFASYGDDFNEEIGDEVANFKSDFEIKCNNAGIDTIDDVVAGGITNGVCLMSKSEAENVDASVKEVWIKTNVKFWLKPEGDKCFFISDGEVVEKSSSEMEGWQYTVNPIVKLNLDKISFDKNEGIITPKDDVTEVKLSDIKTGGLTLKVGETVEVDAENENYPNWYPYPTTDSCFSMYSDRAKSNEINTPANTRYIYIYGTKMGSGQAYYNYSGDRFNVTVNANDSDSTKPDASFTATGSDSGILSNVEGGMQYSLDKGSSWVTIEDGKNSVDIDTGISSENGIKVFKPSSTITNPSDDIEGNQTQGISVTKGTTPTLTSVDPTSVGGKGKVTIPSDGYQQSSDNSTWTDVGSGDIELDAGTYYFRTKPDGTVLASDLQTIVIKSKVSYEVTFKVVNGSWDDDTTQDKTVTLEGFEGDELKLTSEQIPQVGSKPNETYKEGSWDTTPSTDTAITADTTYTYTYIEKTSITPTVSIADWTYGETASTPSVNGNTGNGEVAYTYANKGTTDFIETVPSNAGEYTVKAVVAETDNYLGGEATADFTITKAEVTAPTITAKTYTGEAQTADVETSDLYTVTTNAGGTDVGDYDVVLTLKDAVNYKWTDSEDAAKTLKFNIIAATANNVTVSIAGWTYGEDAKTPKVTADFGADTATYTYSSSENGEYSDTVPTDAGTWYVKANIEATDDYSAGEAKNSFVIEPAAITIMADDKSTIYNEELAELTYTIGGSYVEDDDLGITLSTTAAKGSEPGDYPITVSWKENPNYDAALEDGQYTITKGGVSITVSGYSGKYDGKAHGITVKELEGESGELIGIFDGDSPEATVYYSTKELGKDNYKDDGSKELLTFTDAGKYTVYYYVQCKGYTIDPISGSKTVEITKVPLKVTAKDATITYGDKPDNNGVEYSGFVNDETKNVLKGTLSYNIDYEQYGDVGSSYSIVPKGVTAENYDITFVSGKLKVDPKKLTFTWNDADKKYTYNGKKQRVTAKAKTINDDVLTLTYSDNEKKNAGKYEAKITGVEGQKATNYTLADDESTASYEWEIAKKKMSVTAKDVSVEYDEKEHGIEVKVIDPKSGYTITYGKKKGEYDSRKSPAITKEGSLTVYFKVEADNYITYTGSAKVTVKEKKEGTSSSSVEVKEGTPSVSVNGLDEEAKALQEGESADVNVTMSVEQVAEGSEGGDGITAIRNIAEGRMLTFFDIKVIKDVDSVKTIMDTTTNILEICIPYYHISEEGLAAYRYHGSSATRLTESDSRQDGTYRVDKITKKVYIYTNQFSIYAIGYTVKSSVNEEGDTVYDISGNIRYEDIDGMANLILYRNGEECKRGIAAFTGGVGTYQFEELKEGNYSLRITMDAGKDSFTLEIPIGDVSKQVVE